MSTLSDRLRDATRDIVTGERLLPGLFGHSPIEGLEAAADELDRLTARVAELELAIKWYRYEAAALATNMASGAHSQAVLASVTVLALDAGKRADAALEHKHD